MNMTRTRQTAFTFIQDGRMIARIDAHDGRWLLVYADGTKVKRDGRLCDVVQGVCDEYGIAAAQEVEPAAAIEQMS